ncbi:DUF3618 domain-containing protein [Rhodobacteraceae bacterium KMM 6894]|nr:DUF3618 domain-containing protein [Rhodobacteraceae bacterium KMM 6894]
MTSDKNQSDIQADIENERAALADSLSQLTEHFSPEKLISSVGDTLKDQSGALAHAVVKGARENPVALGLMGAGLAWLLMGGKSSGSASQDSDTNAAYDTRPTPTVRGFNHRSDPSQFTDRVDAAERAMHGNDDTDTSDQSRLAQARQFVGRTAADMRDTLYEGTAELNDIARARVIQAREKAIAAQSRIEEMGGDAARLGRRTFEDNPLLIGAGIAAAGAALAYTLPRTDTENRAFGAHRDALMSEAERVLQEEMDRLKASGRAAMDEVRTMATEAADQVPTGTEAADLAEGKLREAAKRVQDRVEDTHSR